MRRVGVAWEERTFMVLAPLNCPTCQSTAIVKYGKTPDGKQRFHCQNPSCHRRTFLMEYTHRGFLQAVKQQIVDMALNGSGIRDTARVLGISPTTVIDTLKKRR
jgi:insertion element IS1 protein InsB